MIFLQNVTGGQVNDALSNVGNYSYYLVDFDEDGTPELLVDTGGSATGKWVCAFDGNSVTQHRIGSLSTIGPSFIAYKYVEIEQKLQSAYNRTQKYGQEPSTWQNAYADVLEFFGNTFTGKLFDADGNGIPEMYMVGYSVGGGSMYWFDGEDALYQLIPPHTLVYYISNSGLIYGYRLLATGYNDNQIMGFIEEWVDAVNSEGFTSLGYGTYTIGEDNYQWNGRQVSEDEYSSLAERKFLKENMEAIPESMVFETIN